MNMNKSVKANEINSYIEFDEFIGVFDSGMGGISTLIELIKAFPNERFVYFGDNKNAPYGEKSEEEIFKLSEEGIRSFVEAGAKAIVIACNTATSSSLEKLKQKYTIPIIGIEPELEQAVIENAGKNILVLATNSTLSGKLYGQKLNHYLQKKGKRAPKAIHSVAMPKFVEIVEAGKTSNFDVSKAMEEIGEDILKSTSAIVLGCTHFIFLKSQILNHMHALNADVRLYEGSAKVIRSLASQLHLEIDKEDKSFVINKDVSEYERLSREKKLLLLTSDGSKFDLMVDFFNRYFNEPEEDSFSILMKSKHFTKRDLAALLEHIDEFLKNEKLDALDKELIRAKYIECNKVNIRNLSRMHKKTLKYVSERMTWLDNELFKFLSRKIQY